MTADPSPLPDCTGVGNVLSRVGDKWSVQIVVVLHRRGERFNSLKRLVPGVSQQALASALKALERDGLVQRTVHQTTPPQVEYALTPLGRSLSGPIRELAEWAIHNRAAIGASRSEYDARTKGPTG